LTNKKNRPCSTLDKTLLDDLDLIQEREKGIREKETSIGYDHLNKIGNPG
jgi:hypothetical protein